MIELESWLRTHFPLLQNDLAPIVSWFKQTELKKGDYFFKEGKYCDKMSFIHTGILRTYATTEDKEVTQWISTQGHFITDLSGFMLDKPSRWTIQALTDVTLYTIYREDYKEMCLQTNWQQIEKAFILHCFSTMEDRIFGLLSKTADERYRLFSEENAALFNQVPLQYIASMLGMVPETFSRIRKKSMRSTS
jgi:CRP-like cAMP-binding protein